MPSLREQLHILDDDYLAAIANKGLVNRARREAPQTQLSLVIEDDMIEARFSDGIQVKITGTLSQFECSCPSRTICRHVLLAMIKAAEESRTGSETEEERSAITEADFAYLLNFTPEQLIKAFGKSAYNNALFKIASGGTAEIEVSSILNVTLGDSAFVVRFLPGAELEQSVCGCKTKNCRHRLEAILYYTRHKNGTLEFELPESETTIDIEILPYVKTLVEEMFQVGLARLPAGYAETCGQFAVLCHGAGFAAFERLFQTAEKELELCHQKNAAFDKRRLIRSLTSIYSICCALEQGGDPRLAGQFKQQYMELPRVGILGLGASAWYAKSGFCGITAVFYCPELKKTLTFAVSRPAENEAAAMKTIKQMRQAKHAWNLALGVGALAKGELSLTGAKVSTSGRLSSSENVTASLVKPDIPYTHPGLSPCVHEDFTKIKDQFLFDEESAAMIYAVLRVQTIENGTFDRVTQSYKAQMFDTAGNYLVLTIEYSKLNETAIRNLEHMAKNEITPEAMTVSLSLSEETHSTVIFPVAVWLEDGERVNIGEEQLFDSKDGYAKFFEEAT